MLREVVDQNCVGGIRRDAAQLAILYRAGALTPIHIPTDQKKRPAISSAVARIFARICSARAIGSRSFCCDTPAFHGHEDSVVEAARRVAPRADVAAARARADLPRHPAPWPSSGCCRPSIPVAPNRRVARSRKPAIPICVGCWSKRPGIIGIGRLSVPRSGAGSARRPPAVARELTGFVWAALIQ